MTQDFFFRTTKLNYYLLAVPKRFRSIFSLSICISICSAWFFLLYMPLQTTINQCFTTIDTLNAAQDTEEKRGAENSTLQESVYKKQKKIIESSRLYKNNYKSINTMIMLIVDLATKSNISMSSHQPHTPVEHSWYITHSFKTEFQGPFASLVNFLEALKSQPTINLSMVHLSKSDGIVSLVCDFNLIEIKKDCHEIPSIS